MNTEENKDNEKHLENLSADSIEGKNVLAGGAGDEFNPDMPMDEMAPGTLMDENYTNPIVDLPIDPFNPEPMDMPFNNQPPLQTPVGGHKGPGVS